MAALPRKSCRTRVTGQPFEASVKSPVMPVAQIRRLRPARSGSPASAPTSPSKHLRVHHRQTRVSLLLFKSEEHQLAPPNGFPVPWALGPWIWPEHNKTKTKTCKAVRLQSLRTLRYHFKTASRAQPGRPATQSKASCLGTTINSPAPGGSPQLQREELDAAGSSPVDPATGAGDAWPLCGNTVLAVRVGPGVRGLYES